MKLIFLGPQGSGKSTQAKIVAQKYNLPFIEMGQLLRDRAKESDDQSLKIRKSLDAGNLVSDEIVVKTLSKRIKKEDCQNGFVLDGYPRNQAQLDGLKEKIDKVFFIKVSKDETVKRLNLRAREDDTKDVLEKRLSIYFEQTEPLLKHYQNLKILVEINGERSIAEIAQDIESRLR